MSSFTPKSVKLPIAAALGAILTASLLGSNGCIAGGHGASAPDAIRDSSARARREPQGSAQASATLSGVASVARSAAYRRAVTAYARRDFRGALGQIDSLSRTPALSAEAQAFLQHQHDLCETALTGKRATAASSVPAWPKIERPLRTAADADCGPRALLIACAKMKKPARLDALRKIAGTTADGTSLAGMTRAAQSVGLKAAGVQMDRDALSNLSQPAIAWVNGNHYIAVLSVHHSLMDPSVNGDAATVQDPNHTGKEEMPLGGPTGLLAKSGGVLLLLSDDTSAAKSRG